MSAIDKALLEAEWQGGRDDWPECPSCRGKARFGRDKIPRIEGGNHYPGCAMDLALAERGYATQADRDAARERLSRQSAPTLMPPALCEKCGGPLATEMIEGCTAVSCLIKPPPAPTDSPGSRKIHNA